MNTIKTVVFISNFFNHHQKPFSDAMYDRLGDGYLFIETCAMPKERKDMGWKMDKLPPYVVLSSMLSKYSSEYQSRIDEADMVIIGSAPNHLVRNRILANKLVFRYSERPLKRGMELWKYPYRFLKWHYRNPLGKKIYMLCASAYTAGDYARFGLFWNRCYKWGYFPKTERYDDIRQLIASKKKNSLIWVARYLAWKHPEAAVYTARRLKDEGYEFELNMIGSGYLMEKTAAMVKELGLENEVHLLGNMMPEEVRRYMETSQIHLVTSDRNEGWGAVLNESMNSGCVPVANRRIGSAPFLINHGYNGYMYSNLDEMYEKVKYLLDHPEVRQEMGNRAYENVVEEWNAEIGADRLLQMTDHILAGEKMPELFNSGVCSKAIRKYG